MPTLILVEKQDPGSKVRLTFLLDSVALLNVINFFEKLKYAIELNYSINLSKFVPKSSVTDVETYPWACEYLRAMVRRYWHDQ